MLNKLWKPVALGKLRELQSRSAELTDDKEILSFVEGLEIPLDLKTELLRGPTNMGVIFPPIPMGWAIDTTKQSIDRMLEKIRNYKEE